MPRLPAALIFLGLAFLTAISFNATAAIISTYAGGGFSAITNGLPATNAALPGVQGLATDLLGNLFLADASGAVVRRVDPTNGLLTAVAGNGTYGSSGDGGPAAEATLSAPASVAVDLTGNLYVCDSADSRIRKIDATTGLIHTVAGNDTIGYLGDNGFATNASLTFPNGIAVDVHGNLYIADTSAGLVRKVDAATGIIHRFAGQWLNYGHSGDGGPALNARINSPLRIAVDASDNVFFLDQGNRTYVRRIDGVTGLITTIAGGGAGDGASGLATNASLDTAQDLAVDNRGALYVGGLSNVWQVALDSGNISILAGGATTGFAGDGGPATAALLNGVNGLAVSATGDIYISDSGNGRVRKVVFDRPHFGINWFKVAGGGSAGSNTDYKLLGTVGQADAGGPHTNSQFSLVGGFWALPVAVQTTGSPLLQVTPAAAGFATISWSPNTPGFVLQETLALSPSNWINSPSGATNPITVSASLPAKFYRLNKP